MPRAHPFRAQFHVSIKGGHCYLSNPRTNEVCSRIPKPCNVYSQNAIVVNMKDTKGEQDDITVGHVPV